MQFDVRIFLLRFGPCHVSSDDAGVLAMRHELPVLVGTHLIYILQTLAPIHEHITRTGPHEEFYSRDMCTVKRGKRVSIIVGCAIEEAVVHVAVMAGNIHFLLPSLGMCGLS